MVSCPSTCYVWQCSVGCGYVLVCVHRRAWVHARGWGGIGKILQGCLVAQSLWGWMLWSPGLGGAPQHLPPHLPPLLVPSHSSPNTGKNCPIHPCLEHSRSARRDANSMPDGCKASPAPSTRGLQMKRKPCLPCSRLPENLRRQTLLLEIKPPRVLPNK